MDGSKAAKRNRRLFLPVVLALVLSMVVLVPGEAVAAEWEPPVMVSHTKGTQPEQEVVMAQSRGVLHMLYTRITGESANLFYRRSTDGGDTWSPRVKFAQTDGNPIYGILIAAAGDSVHALWHRYPSHGGWENYAVKYRRSDDHGATWTRNRTLTGMAPVSLQADMRNVHLLGLVRPIDDEARELMHWRSRDGENWTDPVKVGKAGPRRTSQRTWWATDFDAGVLHVVQQHKTDKGEVLLYTQSLDRGRTWTRLRRVVGVGSGDLILYFRLSVSKGDVHLAFSRNDRVRYRRSTDYGSTWEATTTLAMDDGGTRWEDVEIDAKGRWVYVAVRPESEVVWLGSKDHGATWSDLGPPTGYPSGWEVATGAIIADGATAHQAAIGRKSPPGDWRFEWVRLYYQRFG